MMNFTSLQVSVLFLDQVQFSSSLSNLYGKFMNIYGILIGIMFSSVLCQDQMGGKQRQLTTYLNFLTPNANKYKLTLWHWN